MKNNLYYLISGIFIFVLNSCVNTMPHYYSSNSSFIIFKTPTLAYADQGFISHANSETKVEIYNNGQALIRLRMIKDQVCISSIACMSNREFNKKVLNAKYPDDTIENIFNGKKIFNGKGLSQIKNGFIQHIKGGIEYKVTRANIKFIDPEAGVKIVIRNN